MTCIDGVLIDKLMLATYFFKRQQSRVASAVQQRVSLAGRSASTQHLYAASNSQGVTLQSFQKQSITTRTLLKKINIDNAANLKQRQEDIITLAAQTTIAQEFKQTATEGDL